MNRTQAAAALLAALCTAPASVGQPAGMQKARQAVEDRFQAFPLKVGEPFPEFDIYDALGQRINTRSLKGKYTVFVTGCLT